MAPAQAGDKSAEPLAAGPDGQDAALAVALKAHGVEPVHAFTGTHSKDQPGSVLEALERMSGWNPSQVGARLLALDDLDGVETGVRSLTRCAPLKVEEKAVGGVKDVVPTRAECLRITAYLALTRNAMRDYLNVAALADKMGPVATAAALETMDAFYPQNNGRGLWSDWIVRTQMVKQFREPKPVDLDKVVWAECKAATPPIDSWARVEKILSGLVMDLLESFLHSLRKESTLSQGDALADESPSKQSVGRREKGPLKTRTCRDNSWEAGMQHRNLNHQNFTLAAIDNIIERGLIPDWGPLMEAIASDPFGEIAKKTLSICENHHVYGGTAVFEAFVTKARLD